MLTTFLYATTNIICQMPVYYAMKDRRISGDVICSDGYHFAFVLKEFIWFVTVLLPNNKNDMGYCEESLSNNCGYAIGELVKFPTP